MYRRPLMYAKHIYVVQRWIREKLWNDRLWVMAFGLYFRDCTVLLPSISHRKLLQSAMLFPCVWLCCEDDEKIVVMLVM